MANIEQAKIDSEISALLNQAREVGCAVIGCGVTGISSAKLLSRAGLRPYLFDENQISREAALTLRTLNVPVAERSLGIEHGQKFAFFLPSPGVAPSSRLTQSFVRERVPVLSEVDLFQSFFGEVAVGVTGTNGKSTTSTLISDALDFSGVTSRLAGNIGTPLFDLLLDMPFPERSVRSPIQLVAELSSYQLEWSSTFSPRVAVCLNLAENHLERHHTMEAYRAAKERIFLKQSADGAAVLNQDDASLDYYAKAVRGRTYLFGMLSDRTSAGAFYDPEQDRIVLRGVEREEFYRCEEFKFLGLHNRLNLAAAILAARLSGASYDGCVRLIREARPLPHRLELVRELKAVRYINDSKSTTPAATAAVLKAVHQEYPGRRILLLLGGKAKPGEWTAVARELRPNDDVVIGFGTDGELVLDKLASALDRGSISVLAKVPTLREAIEVAHETARASDIVLLAPGCASFDAYGGFEQRGQDFKQIVMSLPAS